MGLGVSGFRVLSRAFGALGCLGFKDFRVCGLGVLGWGLGFWGFAGFRVVGFWGFGGLGVWGFRGLGFRGFGGLEG